MTAGDKRQGTPGTVGELEGVEADAARLAREVLQLRVAEEAREAEWRFEFVDEQARSVPMLRLLEPRHREDLARRLRDAVDADRIQHWREVAFRVHVDEGRLTYDARSTYRAHLERVFADALQRFVRDYKSLHVRLPAALIAGVDSFAAIFGRRRFGEGREVQRVDAGPGAARVIVRSGRQQAELFHPGVVEADGEQLLRALAQVLTNREFRTLAACFSLSQEDERNRELRDGAWYHAPSRLADELGCFRINVGTGTRHKTETLRVVDQALIALAQTSVTFVTRVGGRETKRHADRLVYPVPARRSDARTVDPLQRRGPGRTVRQVWAINPFLIETMDPSRRGYYCPVPREALRTPEGVDPRRWDDAFKVLALLSAHARRNVRPAELEPARGLPFGLNCDELLEAANVAGDRVPKRTARAHLARLLELLRTTGFLRFSVRGEAEEAVLRFDLPSSRALLATVPALEAPTDGANAPSRKAPGRRRARGGKRTRSTTEKGGKRT